MKLSVRPLEPQDFEACWAISTFRSQFSTEEVGRLRAAWAYLLPREEMVGAAVEDVSGTSGPRVVAFGATVFASDEWMAKLRSVPKPLETMRLLFEARKPDLSILDQRQIGLYNAQGGLNLVCVHRGEMSAGAGNWNEHYTRNPEAFSAIIGQLIWAFQEYHRGFHLREMVIEAYGPFELQWAIVGGNWKLRSDYVEYYSRSAACFPPEEEHPYLLGMTSEESSGTSVTWCMFQASRPELNFSPMQKRVFVQAVRGHSNASIANRLGISEESVHNCFRKGYDKARDHAVFGGELDDEVAGETGKATSRRRQKFIEILRTHMDELRPWSTKPALQRPDATFFGSAKVARR